MAAKFRNKYRVETTRLHGYDYSRNGAYFITICAKNKIPYFGEIIGGIMILNETGIIVRDFWNEIPNHFPNVHLDEYIIMPDHIHGILIIQSTPKHNFNNGIVEAPNLGASTDTIINGGEPEAPNLGASPDAIINGVEPEAPNLGASTTGTSLKSGNPYWKSNSIGSIINQFKRICTIKSKSSGLNLSWQSRYYDHIIRSDNDLKRIRKYIRNNPGNWSNHKYPVHTS